MKNFEFLEPTSLEETVAQLEQYGDDAKLIAGGTGLVIMLKQGLVQPGVLLSLGRVKGLDSIEVSNGGVRLGALATHREVERSSLVKDRLPVLAETYHHVATIRIRNVATVGGNIAHGDPNLDPPPTLVALDAVAEVVGANGEREIPLTEFFTDYYETALQPGEVLRAIRVPGLPERSGAVFHKFLPRSADDYATVAVTAIVALDEAREKVTDVRLGLGSVGSTVVRARDAEAVLKGRAPTEDACREAAAAVRDAVDPLSDVRGSSEYKRDMAEVWTRRCLLEAARRAGANV